MGRLKLYIIAFLNLLPSLSNAQIKIADQTLQETADLVVNTNLIFSGQELLYRIAILTNSKDQSDIAYVSLIDELGKNWFLNKVAINSNGIGSGGFTMPTDAKTGSYKLLAYTQWSKNNRKAAYHSQDLIVINPFIPLEYENISNINTYKISLQDDRKKVKGKTALLDIKFNKESYTMRDNVILNVSAVNSAFIGNYGLSIRQVPQGQLNQETEISFLTQEENNKANLPETKGELLSGLIASNSSSISLSDQLISLSIPGGKPIFKLTDTDENGHFAFLIDEMYNTSNAIIQVFNESSDFSISIDSKNPELEESINFKKVEL
ncbi:MAG: hypothetical protein WA951_06310, partial [Leeuwenhoekiella sp.]